MNWKNFLSNKIIYRSICGVVIAALLVSVAAPVVRRAHAEPENPLLSSEIEDIEILHAGEAENLSKYASSLTTETQGEGNGQNGDAGQGNRAPGEGEEEDPVAEEEKEENVEGSEDPDSGPSLEQLSQSTVGSTPESDPSGEEGQNDGLEGEEGGEEVELDLAAVMSWYKHGSQEKTIVCQPGSTVGKEIMTAQLQNEQLEYRFSLTGFHAEDVEIISVSYAVGNGVPQDIPEAGTIPVSVPTDPGYQNYVFLVAARGTVENVQGEKVEQDFDFTFVIRCENGKDLELVMEWQETDGTTAAVTCAANGTAGREVKSSELTDGALNYSLSLEGDQAKNSELIAGEYRTASGGYGTLDLSGGVLPLQAGENGKETYYLSFTAKTEQYDEDGERYQETITYSITLTYIDTLDLQLQFVWYEKGVTRRELLCRSNESQSQTIKNNQLSAGALLYEMELVGTSANTAKIKAIALQHNGGSTSVPESGSLPMSLTDGSSSAVYVFQVTADCDGQSVAFTVSLRFTNDVRLQMEYSISLDGAQQMQRVICENGKTVTAETVYDDQLQDGSLSYTMSLLGEDVQGLHITKVACYQSGTMRTVQLNENGTIVLRLEGKRTGENTFTVVAEDGSQTYTFTINIPYKHRGENLVKIRTNLTDGMEVTNGTEVNLTVEAWTEDESGNIVSHILATGSETILTVTLDGEALSYISASGISQEYTLIPQNPDVGDTNEHTLIIYAQDEEGNYGELTLTLLGKRTQSGQEIGTAQIYIDMTVLGLGVEGPVSYTVLSKEPVSYVVAKAVWGQDFGDPFGAADQTFGYISGSYGGTFDSGFYLRSLSPGGAVGASALSGSSWSSLGATEEEILTSIDNHFGRGTGLAALWRCIYRNGLNLGPAGGSSVGEQDYTSGSGWLYSVGRGTYYPGQSMSDYYLQDGDTLVLRYTLAQGWDVGGGTDNYGNTVGYCVSAMNGSIQVNHQMEEVTTETGGIRYMCHCCGLTEDCPHTNTVFKENDAETHGQWCEDCQSWIAELQDHNWQYTDTDNPDTHTGTCKDCGYTAGAETHNWIVESDTATCTQDGEKVSRCMVCEATKSEVYRKDHVTGGQWKYDDANENYHYQLCTECGQEMEGTRSTHTFMEDGMDLYCSVCGVLHFELEMFYGHVFADGTCTVCSAQDPSYQPEESEQPEEPEQPEPVVPEEGGGTGGGEGDGTGGGNVDGDGSETVLPGDVLPAVMLPLTGVPLRLYRPLKRKLVGAKA